ncbi:hypothetical protein FRC08_001632 [Ceratobasidium sp. 394]|nr:hypothetical protein FRC08_001632 [Ceratobasidium sp. 394]KAG9090231.1 hypothetical protein FS749_000730 [Ceratobasidium sp. UAMH 11750]
MEGESALIPFGLSSLDNDMELGAGVVPYTQTTVLDSFSSSPEPHDLSGLQPGMEMTIFKAPKLVPDLDKLAEHGSDLLWVSVNGKAFALHYFLLARHSEFFTDMFCNASKNGEGQSKDHPLCLDPHAPASEWYALLDFIYRSRYDEDPVLHDQAYWISLLSIAHKYGITSAVKEAKENLVNSRAHHMSLSLKIHLGRRYELWDWVYESLSIVPYVPLSKLTAVDIGHLGPDIMQELIRLHERLSAHRAYTCIHLPSVFPKNQDGCTSPTKCFAVWKDLCLVLTKLLIDPVKPARDREILDLVVKKNKPLEKLNQLDRFCYSAIVMLCREAFDGKDSKLIDHIIDKLRNNIIPRLALAA